VNAEEFWSILNAMPQPQTVSWRLYHNAEGEPITYSMEDLPGIYIEVDAETFARSPWNVRVQHGKLVERKPQRYRYQPADTGTPCHPDNVLIVVPESQPHQKWKLKVYEAD
jgi:hypothetical protein